jgi:hypothetical protein
MGGCALATNRCLGLLLLWIPGCVTPPEPLDDAATAQLLLNEAAKSAFSQKPPKSPLPYPSSDSSHQSEITIDPETAAAVFGRSIEADSFASAGPVPLQVRFNVTRIEVLRDRGEAIADIWTYVDSEVVLEEIPGLMAANGWRAGVSDGDGASAIRSVLKEEGGAAKDSGMLLPAGQSLVVTLDETDQEETLFVRSPRERLAGQTISPGQKNLRIDARVRAGEPWSAAVKVTPELWLQETDDRAFGVALQQGRQIRAFSSGDWFVSMEPGDVLVLGLGEDVKSDLLLGPRFFTRKQDGRIRETVLMVKPEVFQVRAARR